MNDPPESTVTAQGVAADLHGVCHKLAIPTWGDMLVLAVDELRTGGDGEAAANVHEIMTVAANRLVALARQGREPPEHG